LLEVEDDPVPVYVGIHEEMLKDNVRTRAYMTAIGEIVDLYQILI
jgi:hypothetical protein